MTVGAGTALEVGDETGAGVEATGVDTDGDGADTAGVTAVLAATG